MVFECGVLGGGLRGRTGKIGFAWDVIHLYKYMHIYLWRDLRMMVLRMEDMRRSFGVSIDYSN